MEYQATPGSQTSSNTAMTSHLSMTSNKMPRASTGVMANAKSTTLEATMTSNSSMPGTSIQSKHRSVSEPVTISESGMKSPPLMLVSEVTSQSTTVTSQSTVASTTGAMWPGTQTLTPEGIVSILPHLAPPGIRISSEVLRSPRHKQISHVASKATNLPNVTVAESSVSNSELSHLGVQAVDLQNVQLVVENIPTMPLTSTGIIHSHTVKQGTEESGTTNGTQSMVVLQQDNSAMSERETLVGTEQAVVNQSDNVLLLDGTEEVIVEDASEIQQ